MTCSQESLNLHRTPTAEELYPDNPAMYEEFRKYEEMYRREKEGKSSSSKKQKKRIADYGINIEDLNKTYDSPYERYTCTYIMMKLYINTVLKFNDETLSLIDITVKQYAIKTTQNL